MEGKVGDIVFENKVKSAKGSTIEVGRVMGQYNIRKKTKKLLA